MLLTMTVVAEVPAGVVVPFGWKQPLMDNLTEASPPSLLKKKVKYCI